MSLPSRVPNDPSGWSGYWGLDCELEQKLSQMQQWWTSIRTGISVRGFRTFPPFFIISGFRTEQHNREIGGAPNSRHIQCPSTAADLRVGNISGVESDEIWAMLGGWWRLHGGRWGGTFSTPDPNHFDLGV